MPVSVRSIRRAPLVLLIAMCAFAASAGLHADRVLAESTAATAAVPPTCPFNVSYCLDKVASIQTCDPNTDPNCVPPPPPPPGCNPATCPPPAPVPCTDPADPQCHIWPQPVTTTTNCVRSRYDASYTCPPVHVGVSSRKVGPVSTPGVDVYEPLP